MSPHEILGVGQNATEQDIKVAHRKKVLACHPDRCFDQDAVQRFRAVQEAYEALTKTTTCPPGRKASTQTPPPPKNPNNWTRDAPPATHDIWGVPYGPTRTHQPNRTPRTNPQRQARKYEPPVDLWKSVETKAAAFSRRYWVEYKRLVIEMAYEEPDKFWETLDDWTKKNR